MSLDKQFWSMVDRVVDEALAEDLRDGDITTQTIIPEDAVIEAEWVAKESALIAGLPIVDRIYQKLDAGVKNFWMIQDGEWVSAGKFGLVEGPAQSILKGERTVLNFLQRLSGIATKTACFQAKVQKYGTKIYDTRKTTPLLRVLEKYAVRMGGGCNHRLGLGDMVMVKDNHREVLTALGIKSLSDVIKKFRLQNPKMEIAIEARNVFEVEDAMNAGAEVILLDNMIPEHVQGIVARWKGKVLFEATGGIQLENVEAFAKTGVDRISVGALTHSVKSPDISLEVLAVK